jgi:probable rRNA maturation factor
MQKLPAIQMDDQQSLFPELGEFLVSKGEELLKKLGLEQAVISLVLCDDLTIQEINRDWRNKDQPTDVLSFPQESDSSEFEGAEDMPQFYGDIVISVETCARQAEEWKHTMEEEAIRLWVHGFLHLCGYDHQSEEETLEMRGKEFELLAMLGSSDISPLARLN